MQFLKKKMKCSNMSNFGKFDISMAIFNGYICKNLTNFYNLKINTQYVKYESYCFYLSFIINLLNSQAGRVNKCSFVQSKHGTYFAYLFYAMMIMKASARMPGGFKKSQQQSRQQVSNRLCPIWSKMIRSNGLGYQVCSIKELSNLVLI